MGAPALTITPTARLRLLKRRSDEDLRSMAAAGDAGAFGALYERHHQALYRYCRSIVRHDEDARDALHNTWTAAWESLQRADREVPPRPWLFRIAHNEAISLLRRRRSHEDLARADDVRAVALEDQIEVRHRLAILQADLDELPERQRSALLLRELCGLGHAEIATILSVSTAAAKQTIFEARQGLHEAEAGRTMTCADVQRTISDADGRAMRGRRIRAHLRACGDCRAFHEALRRRPGQLAALAPPLPPALAAGLLAKLLGGAGGGAGGGGSAAGASGAAMAAGKVGLSLAAKAAVGAIVVAGAGVAVDVAGKTVLPRAVHAATPGSPRSAGALRLASDAHLVRIVAAGASTPRPTTASADAAASGPSDPGNPSHGHAAHGAARGNSAANASKSARGRHGKKRPASRGHAHRYPSSGRRWPTKAHLPSGSGRPAAKPPPPQHIAPATPGGGEGKGQADPSAAQAPPEAAPAVPAPPATIVQQPKTSPHSP